MLFCGLKVRELSFFSKVGLDAKSKQRIRGTSENDLSNIDQNFGYLSLLRLKFFIVLVSFFQDLHFYDLKGTEVLSLDKTRLDAKCKHWLSCAP